MQQHLRLLHFSLYGWMGFGNLGDNSNNTIPMSLIEDGLKAGYIIISDDGKQITYVHQNKKRNYTNPEEKVQAETFLKLIIDYGYPAENIELYKTVTMGSDKKEADIIVYENAEWTKPIIVVECKKEDVSQQEFLQAVEQAYSYAHALAGTVKYIWVTSIILNSYYRYDKETQERASLQNIPLFGSDKVAPYRFVKGGGKHKYLDGTKEVTQEFADIQPIPESKLIKVFKQAHDALWAGGQLNPSEAFDELDKLIFCKIWDEKYRVEKLKEPNKYKLHRRKKGEVYDFQVIEETGKTEEARRKTNAALAKRIKQIYKAGKEFDKEVFKDDIRLSDERIRTIVGYFEGICLDKTDLDSKGRAFETFLGSFFRGEFGQYFTPRVIVQFIVEALPIEHTSLVLDTSCGSGGFLLHALDKVRRQADDLYPDHETDAEERELWKEHWHTFASQRLYGIEINEQIARTAKMNMIIHDDGHTNVISLDGLLSPDEVKKSTDNAGFKYGRFDFIITNPPFGSSIKNNEKNYLKQFALGKKEADWLAQESRNAKTEKEVRNNQSTEVLFLEQCYNYLHENGYLAVVIPDGILTNSSLQYVRDQIEDWYRIVAVVSMPQTAFTATGAGVKSSVLFLRKYTKEQTAKSVKDKETLKQKLLKGHDYFGRLDELATEKNKVLANLTDYPYYYTDKATEKKEERHKEWRAEISALFTEKQHELKEMMQDAYAAARKEYFKKNPKQDYPIFMAIAENIGYDATGKSCAVVVSKSEIIKGGYKHIEQLLRHDLFDEHIVKKEDLQGEEVETKKTLMPEGILKALQGFIKDIEDGRV